MSNELTTDDPIVAWLLKHEQRAGKLAVEIAREAASGRRSPLFEVERSDEALADLGANMRRAANRIRALTREATALRADQADWRKGVALIASALGEKEPSDLCCVRLSRIALEQRAESERRATPKPVEPPAGGST